MIDSRLLKYISLALGAGFSREPIKLALLRANWPEKIIDQGFFEFQKRQKINEERLLEYIEKTLALGFTKDQVLSALLKAQWPEPEIEKTLFKLNFSSSNDILLAPPLAKNAPALVGPGPEPKPKTFQQKFFDAPSSLAPLTAKYPEPQKISLPPVAQISPSAKSKKHLGAAKTLIAQLLMIVGLLVMALFSVIISFFSVIFFLIKQFIRFVKIFPKIFIQAGKKLKIVFGFLFKAVVFPFRLPAKIFYHEKKAMRFPDMIRLAGRMFKTRRLRTTLTILGISIGIGTILFLVSLGYGLQNMLLEQITSSDALLSIDVTSGGKEVIPLDKNALDKMRALPFVVEISPMSTFAAQVTIKNQAARDLSANTIVNAVEPSFFRLSGLKASWGNFFVDANANEILVSEAVTKLFNLEASSIIGKEVTFAFFLPKPGGNEEETETIERPQKYKIVGVINDPESNYVYLPAKTISDLNLNNFALAKVRVAKDENLEQTRTEIFNMGYSTSAISDTITEAKKIFAIVQIVLSIFGIIALIVSAIGMFNTITIALLERTQEIGIMKSLGASNRDVWKLFLTESIIMGFLGGVGGLATSYVGSGVFNYGVNFLAKSFGGQPVNLFQRPLWFIITIVAFSTIVGFIVGLWPARRAARINPLEALRYK